MSFVFGMNRYEHFKNVGGLNHQPNLVVRYAQNARRVPQVMFKAVKTGYASGFIGLSAQMGYVLGKSSKIIDPSGEVDGLNRLGAKEVSGLASRWVDGWVKSAKDNRHSMHLVASFPAGTHPGAVEYIIRDTCEELLSQGRNRFEYVAAIHTDTNNPHGHILVNRRNDEGEWFFLARDHEYSYDRFKDSLVRHAAKYGVELNNSSRLSRGIADYPSNTRNYALRGIEGKVLDFGAAPYQHQNKGSDSFYIKIQSERFGERTFWGVGLASAMNDSGAEVGSTVRIAHAGKETVVVHTKDGETINTHRNAWSISVTDQESMHSPSFANLQPTSSTLVATNLRRDLVLSEAGHYQKFSNILKGSYLALGIAFTAAANVIRNGNSIDFINSYMEKNMSDGIGISEADINKDASDLYATIEKAKGQLDEVWKRIPSMNDAERPLMEQNYFNAVGDMDRLMLGEQRREFIERAEGSIYTDERRNQLANGFNSATEQRLDQSGISKQEFASRMTVSDCSFALESHWIERDAQSIARVNQIDMSTVTGRAEALQKTAELHAAIIGDLNETYSEKPLDGLVPDPERINELRDLAKKDSLTFDDSKRITESLNELLGENGMERLNRADTSVFKDAGIDIDRDEAVKIAEAYSEALAKQGYNTEKFDKALSAEKEVLKTDAQIERLHEDERHGETARNLSLKDDNTYKL